MGALAKPTPEFERAMGADDGGRDVVVVGGEAREAVRTCVVLTELVAEGASFGALE